MEVLIELDKHLEISVNGEYIAKEEENEIPDIFEIEGIYVYKGNQLDLCEWVSAQKGDYLKVIEEKVLEKIKEE